ncbi:MAG: hypothetical protein ACRDP1_09745 [Nocardioidaceae bacterium]
MNDSDPDADCDSDSGSDSGSGSGSGSELICSAKGCHRRATWAHLWNNPRLHTPERRKTWLACDEHKATLAAFLGARGFLRETRPLPLDD